LHPSTDAYNPAKLPEDAMIITEEKMTLPAAATKPISARAKENHAHSPIGVPYWKKMLVCGGVCPPMGELDKVLLSSVGVTISIAFLAVISVLAQQPILIAPFAVSSFLVFTYPLIQLSQPRSIFFSYLLTTILGFAVLGLLGEHWWTMGLATGLGVAVMHVTRALHPPAAAMPVIVLFTAPSWTFIFTPVITGTICLIACAVVVNNIPKNRHYPHYWL
jgi:CBS-domain-containing membrane protein